MNNKQQFQAANGGKRDTSKHAGFQGDAGESKRDEFWFDPAVAQLDPDDPKSLWCCSVRGGINGGVICWAEGETPEETRARTKTICDALNGQGAIRDLCAVIADLLAQQAKHAPELLDSLISEAARMALKTHAK